MFVGLPLSGAESTKLRYYLPGWTSYDPSVPKPSDVLGFEVGEWHVRHDQLVRYFEVLAEQSERVQLKEIGRTHEGRRLIHVYLSDPGFLKDVRSLRSRRREAVLSGRQSDAPTPDHPVVVNLCYSVHGNESSGANASLLAAYHFAAAQDEKTRSQLKAAVVVMDPVLNPDGFSRFAQWANSHKGYQLVGQREHREHQEAWPGGRGNHYWFDLNRDWLLCQHPESQARVREFQKWLPNVVADFHEMGSDATYFFQPGVPERRNPLTPLENVEMTSAIAGYHAKALDQIHSRYFTEERFDDFYYGKGSTYPDIHGAVGILFEQASSRGHLMESVNGTFDFPFTIRNQLVTSLSTVEGAVALKEALMDYQRRYFAAQVNEDKEDTAGYLFGDAHDFGRTTAMVEILRRHQIEVREITKRFHLPAGSFDPGRAYWVPLSQPQRQLVKSFFERATSFEDSIFYDVSTWTLPLAFDMPMTRLDGVPPETLGERLSGVRGKRLDSPDRALEAEGVGVVLRWTEHDAPSVVYRLLSLGFNGYVAHRAFGVETSSGAALDFEAGSVFFPFVEKQSVNRKLLKHVSKARRASALQFEVVRSGLTPRGMDLGSSKFKKLRLPKPAILVGAGISGYEAGEMWHLLDAQFGIPVSLIEKGDLSRERLQDYTHLFMVHGNYAEMADRFTGELSRWIESGGVLVGVKSAAKWLVDKKLGPSIGRDVTGSKTAATKSENGSIVRLDYAVHEKQEGAKNLGGAIFLTDLDITHPLGFGYADRELPFFKNSKHILELPPNPYSTVAQYAQNPLLSGYAHREDVAKIALSAAVMAEPKGSGAVILMADNPNFRAYWKGTTKLVMNCLFFGGTIESTRTLQE